MKDNFPDTEPRQFKQDKVRQPDDVRDAEARNSRRQLTETQPESQEGGVSLIEWAIERLENRKRLAAQKSSSDHQAGVTAMQVHLEECLAGRVEPTNPTMQMLLDWRDGQQPEQVREALELLEKCKPSHFDFGGALVHHQDSSGSELRFDPDCPKCVIPKAIVLLRAVLAAAPAKGTK